MRMNYYVLYFLLGASSFAAPIRAQQSEPHFVALFNGNDLSGWEGDERFWSVKNGVIAGETTEDNPTEANTFLVYREGTFADFELRFSFQVKGGNSGIQYRSELMKDWVVKGLQADFEDEIHEGKDLFSGMFFEENGRMFMAQRGECVVIRNNPTDGNKPLLEKIASVGDATELEKVINRDAWNDYSVVARENVFIHSINGRVMSIAIDEDAENYRESGILAWQLHAGPPINIKLRDIRIRKLD